MCVGTPAIWCSGGHLNLTILFPAAFPKFANFTEIPFKIVVPLERFFIARADLRVGWGFSFLHANWRTPTMKTSGKQLRSNARSRSRTPSPEGTLERLFAWLDHSLVRQAAGELARECHVDLWEATSERASQMTRDEGAGIHSGVRPRVPRPRDRLGPAAPPRAGLAAAADPGRSH